MSAPTTDPGALQELATADFLYREGLAPAVSDARSRGEYLGSGDGRVSGARLNGEVRWDLYEMQGDTQCEMYFVGRIDTDDGARIDFETNGYGIVPDPDGAPNLWSVTAALRFHTEDAAYDWLALLAATWHGTFDMRSFRHRYRIFTTGTALEAA